jgi:hypothetical protein
LPPERSLDIISPLRHLKLLSVGHVAFPLVKKRFFCEKGIWRALCPNTNEEIIAVSTFKRIDELSDISDLAKKKKKKAVPGRRRTMLDN